MFTGLIQHRGRLAGSEPHESGIRLQIDAQGWTHVPEPGSSIAVNGCCLTLAEPCDRGDLAFVAIPETLEKTTLGGLKEGDPVNLEHALAAEDLLGGHVVQGHVDGVGTIEAVTDSGEYRLRIRTQPDLAPYLVPKGSVTIEGVSLTLASVEPPHPVFEVALIPETLARTSLGGLRAGSRVNVEADCLVKALVHHMRHFAPSGLSHGAAAGFDAPETPKPL